MIVVSDRPTARVVVICGEPCETVVHGTTHPNIEVRSEGLAVSVGAV